MTKASAFRSVDFTESGWRQINASGGVTTVLSSDAFSVLAISAVGTSTHTVQVPNNDFPKGFQTVIARIGSAPVRINSANATIKLNLVTGVQGNLASQFSVASIIYSGNPSTGWLVFGDLN
jgi:hypothetical protein